MKIFPINNIEKINEFMQDKEVFSVSEVANGLLAVSYSS